MLTDIHPKLPMRNKAATMEFYRKLGFRQAGADYDEYLMMRKDGIEMHFFLFKELNPAGNYGQVYIRTDDVDNFYREMLESGATMHPAAHLETKPWGQKEFAMLDPDNNLLTFGQPVQT